MTKKQLLFILLGLVAGAVVLTWSPWMSADIAAKKVINRFEEQWQDVADGCGFNCEGCGVKSVRRMVLGYAVEIEYACGMLPADLPEYHQHGVYYVSPVGTAHSIQTGSNGATSAPLPTLVGTEWTLTFINNQPAAADVDVTLAFPNPNEISGNAGCNYYGGRYTSSDNTFTIEDGLIHKTNYDCDVAAAVMQQETVYLDTLTHAISYEATEGRLEITGGSGPITLAFDRKLPPLVDAALLNTEWILFSIPGHTLDENINITLDFEATSAGGYAGCNYYGGTYEVASGGSLSFAELAVTAQACETPAGVMAQEETYLDAFGNSVHYRVTETRLELADVSGQARLVFERKVERQMHPGDLIGTAWQLTSLNGNALTGDAVITLTFLNGQELEGHAVCRDYTASYEADGDDIRFPMLSMQGESCFDQPELLEQEGEYIDIFSRVINFNLGDNRLEFISVRNEVLVFEPLQPAQE